MVSALRSSAPVVRVGQVHSGEPAAVPEPAPEIGDVAGYRSRRNRPRFELGGKVHPREVLEGLARQYVGHGGDWRDEGNRDACCAAASTKPINDAGSAQWFTKHSCAPASTLRRSRCTRRCRADCRDSRRLQPPRPCASGGDVLHRLGRERDLVGVAHVDVGERSRVVAGDTQDDLHTAVDQTGGCGAVAVTRAAPTGKSRHDRQAGGDDLGTDHGRRRLGAVGHVVAHERGIDVGGEVCRCVTEEVTLAREDPEVGDNSRYSYVVVSRSRAICVRPVRLRFGQEGALGCGGFAAPVGMHPAAWSECHLLGAGGPG